MGITITKRKLKDEEIELLIDEIKKCLIFGHFPIGYLNINKIIVL